ncbi:MAG: methylated-DNA--[protein]-cysteine S-methyltransferase [Treponema sp.]|nr:methylated-DNA--[protein]-cysteine S-methyltransferase [Treponema sp.]
MNRNHFSYRFAEMPEMPEIVIVEEAGRIVALDWGGRKILDHEGPREETDLLREAALQLRQYLAATRRDFDLPLELRGTEFQRAVWQALREIPYGETRSYKEVAEAVGRPKAVRAVGMANNRNPVAIVVPCHRVIGSDGSLVGYAAGLALKRRLLELEGKSSFREN